MRSLVRTILLLVLAALLGGCGGERREGRVRYNEGVAALAKNDHDAAIKALLDARSGAGVDQELLFRSAYDLGIAYAAKAGKLQATEGADLAEVLALLHSAETWLGDAGRQRPDHADTKTNLAIVRARAQAITDELRKAEGTLEARIDAVIEQQREVLEGVRDAWLEIKAAGGADPMAQHGRLLSLAGEERGIVAEVGAIGDLAADEIDAIAKRPEEQRSDEEKVRVVQLKSVDLYLLEARSKIADARRKLQDLATADALSRAEAALVTLKRAREQLLDPITVLRAVASDQLALLDDTRRGSAPMRITAQPVEIVPAWLEPAALAERQSGLRDRLGEIRARLEVAASTPPGGHAQGAQPDAKQEKVLERVRAALPSLTEASGAMDRARQALADKQLSAAIDHEGAALVALARAIEEFADLRHMIELAYADQTQIVALLGPDAAKELPGPERARQTKDALARNLRRMTRLQALIADEVAQLAAQEQQLASQPAAAAGSAAAPADDAAKQHEAAKQQLEAAKQQYARAEQLRTEAAAALAQLETALAKNTDPMPPAQLAHAKLEELRRLFFSVIEHLQQLIRDQGETRDQTSVASGEDELARRPKLPGIVVRQEEHAGMAKAITEALAQQADAAAKAAQSGAAPGAAGAAPDPKALASAADEVRLAQSAMGDARGTLVKARDATNTSESIATAVESQAKAIEHLENALRLLQPPKQQNNDDQQQQEQQQQDQQQDQQQSRQGAAQAARDQDAKRQRDRQEKAAASETVEKDW